MEFDDAQVRRLLELIREQMETSGFVNCEEKIIPHVEKMDPHFWEMKWHSDAFNFAVR